MCVCTICYIIKLTHSSSCTKWTSFCRISSSTLWTTETEGTHLSSASSSQPSVQWGSRVVRTCPWCWSSSPTSDVWGKGVGTAPGWQPANQHPNLMATQNSETFLELYTNTAIITRAFKNSVYNNFFKCVCRGPFFSVGLLGQKTYSGCGIQYVCLKKKAKKKNTRWHCWCLSIFAIYRNAEEEVPFSLKATFTHPIKSQWKQIQNSRN